jgi:hypothetical protein
VTATFLPSYRKVFLLEITKINPMKISRIKFVLLFLSGLLFFLSLTCSLDQRSGPFPKTERLFRERNHKPAGRGPYPQIYPVKIVLIGPMVPLINLPDPPPPFLVVGGAFY